MESCWPQRSVLSVLCTNTWEAGTLHHTSGQHVAILWLLLQLQHRHWFHLSNRFILCFHLYYFIISKVLFCFLNFALILVWMTGSRTELLYDWKEIQHYLMRDFESRCMHASILLFFSQYCVCPLFLSMSSTSSL